MKKVLFISYSSKNLNKVNLITKELKNHPLFSPLVVANNREVNKALIKKVTDGIKSSYRVIAILTKESINEQWINQEIGYAYGSEKEVIPIIEKILLKKDRLNGFIHNQNDCPYAYPTRKGLLMREENKGFMVKFRLLIEDLESELKPTESSPLLTPSATINIAQDIINAQVIHTTGLSTKRTPLGTIAKTSEICPENGEWESIGVPKALVPVTKGFKMPLVKGRSVNWKLVKYV
jgi:hypothetical protein